MTTGKYQMKLSIGDGAKRTVTLIDSDRNLTVDEIRVPEFGSISSGIRSSSPAYVVLNLMGIDGGSKGFLAGGSSSNVPNLATWQPDVYAYSTDQIISFPFSAEADHTDVANLFHTQSFGAGAQSTTHGYQFGGTRESNTTPPYNYGATIQKFSFTDGSNGTDVGDLTQARATLGGHTSSTHGYATGGGTSPFAGGVNTIEKFPFSSDANAATVGDLVVASRFHTGVSSTTHGYTIGGANDDSLYFATNSITKFSTYNDGDASDVGDLIGVPQPGSQQNNDRGGMAGHQDVNDGANYGFVSGGAAGGPSPGANIYSVSPGSIQRFSFSSDGNATVIGELGLPNSYNHQTGLTSPTKGYNIGGALSGAKAQGYSFPFASSASAGTTISSQAWPFTGANNVPRGYMGTMGTQI